MNKILLSVLLAILLLPVAVFAAERSGGGEAVLTEATTKIRMAFEGHEVVIAMFDNPASRDFMELLPLQIKFKDFAGAEKIAYPPRELNRAGSPPTREAVSDFTYYAPWGNLAVFYKGFGNDAQLYPLGRIESGKEALLKMNLDFTARIDKIE